MSKPHLTLLKSFVQRHFQRFMLGIPRKRIIVYKNQAISEPSEFIGMKVRLYRHETPTFLSPNSDFGLTFLGVLIIIEGPLVRKIP